MNFADKYIYSIRTTSKMENIKIEQDDENTHTLKRPKVLEDIIDMEIDRNAQIEIIDLCTPTFEQDDLSMIPTSSLPTKSISTSVIERFPNLNHRISILPWFPMHKTQDQGFPLLVNIPRMFMMRDTSSF